MTKHKIDTYETAVIVEDKDELEEEFKHLVIGQHDSVERIIPYIQIYKAHMHVEESPVGVFLLLGPTGCGKTWTVEALAQCLHGSRKNMFTINCGEFQMDHEISKLMGAPPGYLGHREDGGILTQKKLDETKSDKCGISIVLFDEIEKASTSLHNILLGVLDKGTLSLGNGLKVNFNSSLIFMTSNLGVKELDNILNPKYGILKQSKIAEAHKVTKVGVSAAKAKFSKEFMNRIDEVLVYKTLDKEDYSHIVDAIFSRYGTLVYKNLGINSFTLGYHPRAKNALVESSYSMEYGARELKRHFKKDIWVPLSKLVSSSGINPSSTIIVDYEDDKYVFNVKEEDE